MRTNWLWVGVAGLLLLGCGPRKLITADNAEDIGNDLAANTQEFAGLYEEDGGEGTSAAPCLGGGEFNQDPQNDASDDDIDLIPVHWGTSYTDCVVLGITVNGHVWRSDADPATPGFAWDAARENLTYSIPALSLLYNVSVTADNAGGTYSLDVSGNRGAEWDDGNETHSATQTLDWLLEFTPDGAWDPFTEAFPAGTIGYTGSWNFTVDDASADATLSTPTPIHISPTCVGYVDSGSVMIEFVERGDEGSITVTWDSCGSHSVTFTL